MRKTYGMLAAAAASAAYLALAGAAVCAAWQDKKVEARPEIHGVVLEPGTNQPVADAEVSLVLFPEQGPHIISSMTQSKPLLTGKTDANGAFSFSLEKFGDYYLAIKKDGYSPPGPGLKGISASAVPALSSENPSREVRLFLARPGQLTGRVVNKETGKPIANFPLIAFYRVCFSGRRTFFPGGAATTDSDGRFVASGLNPGDYVVAISPRRIGNRGADCDTEDAAVPGARLVFRAGLQARRYGAA